MGMSITLMDFTNRNVVLNALFLVVFCFGCGNSDTRSTPETPVGSTAVERKKEEGKDVVLIFLDKTLSLNDQSVLAKFKQPIQSKLYDLVNENEDRAAVHLLHGNTASSQTIVSETISVPPLDEAALEEKGGRTRQDMIDAHEEQLNRGRNDIIKYVKSAFDVDNTETSRLQTDIWGALEVMSETFSACNEKDNKHVFFVSDMEESMRDKDRRDFTKKKPADKSEAEAWAAEDLEKIEKQYKIQADVLAGTRINIFLPAEAQEDNGFRFIKYYWETIFGALGISIQEVRGIEIGM